MLGPYPESGPCRLAAIGISGHDAYEQDFQETRDSGDVEKDSHLLMAVDSEQTTATVGL